MLIRIHMFKPKPTWLHTVNVELRHPPKWSLDVEDEKKQKKNRFRNKVGTIVIGCVLHQHSETLNSGEEK